MDKDKRVALLATSNLMFRSKLALTLAEVGLKAVNLRGADDLRAALDEHEPVIIVFDLGSEAPGVIARVEALRSDELGYAGKILCYGPHVQTEILAEAKEAGADLVVPNSVISARGAKIIGELISAD